MPNPLTSHQFSQTSPILLFLPLLITLTSTLETPQPAWLPKIVWTFWDKPIEDDNHLLKALHKNHMDKLENNGWQIRHLNNENIWKYLQGIPKINEAKNHKFWEELVIAQRVDLMRLAILGEYGGVYMDMSIILTQSLDWLLDMKNNPDIQNKYTNQPNFFHIYATHTYKQHYYDQQTSQQYLIQPSIQVFFLASKPNNKFIKQWYTFAIDTKIQTYHQYKHSDMLSVFIDIANKQNIYIGGFNQKYFQISIAGIILLARKQRQLDVQWAVDREKTRRLVVKEERIWTSDANKNAYRYYSFNMGYFKPFVTVNLNLLKRNQKIPPFFKFWHEVYSQLQTLLKMNITQKCNPNFYILQNSILYQYLLKDYPQKFYHNPIFNQQTLQKQCPPQSQVQRLRLQIINMREQIKKQVMIKIQDTVMLWIKFGILFIGLIGLVYFKFFYQGSERGRDGGKDGKGKIGRNSGNSARREIQVESFMGEDQ